MGKTCYFVGSHDTPEGIMDILQGSVELHIIHDGVTDFYVGNHGNFDRMAARAVMRAKQRYPHIQLILVRAYHPSQQSFPLPEGFDASIYPEGLELVPRRLAILKANHLVIDRADHLITYVDHAAGNAKKLSDYAKRRMERGKLKIEDIYKASLSMKKPCNLDPETTVLLTSRDDSVVPDQAEVAKQMQGLIAEGFRVMIADLTSPFGQLAMEALLILRKNPHQFTVCCVAGKPVHQRVNARAKYAEFRGYLELCVLSDCMYFYDRFDEALTSSGHICTEKGRSQAKGTAARA